MIKSMLIVLLILSVNSRASESEHLRSLEADIFKIQQEHIQLQIEKQEVQKLADDISAKISANRKSLLSRIKARQSLQLYKWGEFLVSSDLTEINRNLKIMKNLNEHDREMFSDLRAQIKMLSFAQKNLKDTDLLLKSNIAKLEDQLRKLRDLELLEIENLKKTKGRSLLTLKGRMTRPLDRQPILTYGHLRDSDSSYYLTSRGETYETNGAESIRSVGPGVVIFSDLMPDGRETLIVQHPGQYFSVYAHIKPLQTRVGLEVKEGQAIGKSREGEFYFELRHYVQPIDPNSWYERSL